ncbi:hypothetical protein HEK616_84170 (plasmid) [Streptomyces nigrescens]|uniref:Uncharacterized protein n=1 Tax=Streptomyces nigrescens TaxID=1920 RepID=A0ABM8A861_STRNI|nr:DUF6166 domain-containing protein [Streptomyces nigrescens]BDM74930.1 hypothetical protein HEK616_84170 [Streptomyces nigrescens]
MTDEDCTYHGIARTEEAAARLIVEKPENGPTERRNVQVLRELKPTDEEEFGGFGWGYNGSGTSRVAAAIIADALDLRDAEKSGLGFPGWPQDDTLIELREDFCTEVLSQLTDEWRLRRSVVLRWIHSWHVQHGIVKLPEAISALEGSPA